MTHISKELSKEEIITAVNKWVADAEPEDIGEAFNVLLNSSDKYLLMAVFKEQLSDYHKEEEA